MFTDSANLTDSFYIGNQDVYADEWTYIAAEDDKLGTETIAFLRDDIGVPLRSTFIGESHSGRECIHTDMSEGMCLKHAQPTWG